MRVTRGLGVRYGFRNSNLELTLMMVQGVVYDFFDQFVFEYCGIFQSQLGDYLQT